MKEPTILIEVAYAQPGKQWRTQLRIAPGSTVGDAIRVCGLLTQCPEIDLTRNRVGIFGRLALLDSVVRDGCDHF